eukprot:15113-Heterococcus_DN1.PRE.2
MSAKWDRNAGTASPHRKLRRKWAKKPERQLNHCARALVQKSKAKHPPTHPELHRHAQEVVLTRSAIVESSVSPDLWLVITPQPFCLASLTASIDSVIEPICTIERSTSSTAWRCDKHRQQADVCNKRADDQQSVPLLSHEASAENTTVRTATAQHCSDVH